MIQEVLLSGYTANPSDYSCPDGQLDVSLGAIADGTSVKPITLPEKTLTVSGGGKVVALHYVSAQHNYIIAKPGDTDGTTNLFWLPKQDDVLPQSDNEAVKIDETYQHIKAVQPIGNVLAIATDSGLRYAIWRDGNYVALEEKPPFVDVSFGMVKVGEVEPIGQESKLEVEGRISLPSPGSGASGTHIPVSDDEQKSTSRSNAIWGYLLENIADKITSQGYLHMPFYVRYAFRLFDGSYAWHSAPVLMLPYVCTPKIVISEATYDGDTNTTTLTSRIDLPFFCLVRKMMPKDLEGLKKWKEIVAGIDVFMSKPIYTYNQGAEISISRLRSYFTDLTASSPGQRPGANIGTDTASYSSDSQTQEVFVGHYGDFTNFADVYVNPSDYSSQYVLPIPTNDDFLNQVKEPELFYKIDSIDFDDIVADSEYKQIEIKGTTLTSLEARVTLADDYQSHCGLNPNCLFAFNSRLNIADLTLTPAAPFALRSSCAASTHDSATAVSARVLMRTNGIIVAADMAPEDVTLNAWDIENDFPRFLFYPDSNAFKIIFSIHSGGATKNYSVPLTPCQYLNGAYYFRGLTADAPTQDTEIDTTTYAALVSLQNKVYTSAVNNPFLFPLAGINTVGTGRILGISTAAKALSQGQFGQFPLYAFTDEGVWALETAADGSYSARQPITRDVCINADAITQMDSAVLFPTVRGIMVISGSQTQCLSEVINTDTPFDVATLPGLDAMHRAVGFEHNARCLPLMPFPAFLQDCGMLYDYAHQRVIVYNKQCNYAYALSLNSQQWAFMHADIRGALNSYPDALAIGGDGTLLNYSAHNTNTAPALIVTRPLKLGAPNALKTVDAAIVRGSFQKGRVATALYASRDLRAWHLVWSSKDHYLRGFSGSPYKYYRLAAIANLDDGDSITGVSMSVNPRLANRIR